MGVSLPSSFGIYTAQKNIDPVTGATQSSVQSTANFSNPGLGAGVSIWGNMRPLKYLGLGLGFSYATFSGAHVDSITVSKAAPKPGGTVDLSYWSVGPSIFLRLPIVYVALEAGVQIGFSGYSASGLDVKPLSDSLVGVMAAPFARAVVAPICQFGVSAGAAYQANGFIGDGGSIPGNTMFTAELFYQGWQFDSDCKGSPGGIKRSGS